jgi:hypothetical protein
LFRNLEKAILQYFGMIGPRAFLLAVSSACLIGGSVGSVDSAGAILTCAPSSWKEAAAWTALAAPTAHWTARGVFSTRSAPAAFVGTSVASRHRATQTTQLQHAPKAPTHDVGDANAMNQMDPEQLARAQAYMAHQQSVPKIGFPTDVRSLVSNSNLSFHCIRMELFSYAFLRL